MSVHEANKQVVWDYGREVGMVQGDTLVATLGRYVRDDAVFNIAHPVNTVTGVEALAADFWGPFLHAFKNLHKCPYIFMAGGSFGADWVSATGDFVATFANDWLGLKATHTNVRLRFGEFYAVKAGEITGGYLMLDIPELARQAGVELFPPSLGRELWIPGPLDGDGVMLSPQDEAVSAYSRDLVAAMLVGLDSYDETNKESMGMTRYWHVDTMRWYASHGIGSNFGLKEFEDNHQLPWLHAFPDRKGDGVSVMLAEGNYVSYAGWPITHATHRGDYLGAPATNRPVSMRGLDWWKRDGDKLLENWVFGSRTGSSSTCSTCSRK